ncbi:leucine-rich repeats and immunoglobulin-like domains protein 2 [Portunus trituberculatus]|uniref:leucine-rich repeats and immunoglobulin-like domains protein 2 n=1 Tax=Portunus trituberculatus TaxID=210409 RepID=UPI001E1CEFB8|nr:leucine-rich repeats and immunoglobulin-like domains protein 2 [Portunus trituberculatus]XP_045108289.1 leucine-rich repeats and immunoglobulin-like domains protein 2 [Portunus trituberculatus]XP_045108290.1 leucine-rich repeats and immunoglobulin-like domains protein 2 [Portunus trituberculatus]
MAVGISKVLLSLLVLVGIVSASFPVFPSLLPPSTTLVGPAEVEEVRLEDRAFFLQPNNTETRVQVGAPVILHCPAHDVGDNTVSWIRRRDYHLLTVGDTSYTSDERFQVRYVKQEKDWQLHILYVQARDDGVYECQVTSHPPVSLMSTLHVHEATSEILGGPEKYVRVGSSLRLVCVLRGNTEPPAYVFWYHGRHMINFHDTREVRVENSGALSVLFLSHVSASDSGNYTCAPSNTRAAYILIHVLKGGETPAAIHSGERKTNTPPCLFLLLLLLLLLVTPTSGSSSQLSARRHRLLHVAGQGGTGVLKHPCLCTPSPPPAAASAAAAAAISRRIPPPQGDKTIGVRGSRGESQYTYTSGYH